MSDAIYDAFASLLAQSTNYPVAYPAVKFDPPHAGLWLEVQWFPNQTGNYGWGDNAPSLLQGFAQIGVCGRPGSGLAPLDDVADGVIEAFGKGAEFDKVRVYRKPWKGAAIIDPARVMVPVTIPWRGFDR